MPAEALPLSETNLARRYASVRAQSLQWVEGLSAEDCALQSMPDASPLKWHLAHTTWFFETFVLERYARAHAPFDPAYRYLYNSYYNAIGEQYPRAQRGLLSRPALDDIRAYRDAVDAQVGGLLATQTLTAEALAIVELGLHHEQQHQELMLTDFKHLLSANPLSPAYREGKFEPREAALPMAWSTFDGGVVEIGHGGTGFAFDNESPRHKQHIIAFELADRAVSNGEYLEFIEDKGKFMSNQYVLRGGSCATPQSHIRASYRNFFPSAARWQFSGIRLARDLT
jgi:ergothioneine biosynthesis protein EgtB